MLANDIIGFHTHAYCINFLRCCDELLEGAEVDYVDGRSAPTTATRRWPGPTRWGSTPSGCGGRRTRPEVAEAEREVLERRRRYLIIRVDRADLSKNVLRGFTAFDTFLTQHPEFREQVTFIAHLQPSRQDVPEYAEYRERIEALVAVVNHRHGTTDWMPIDLQIYENFPDAVARYKHYDLLMVNAIFDGMNLVAKEAPAVNTRDGVLMLSENTGSHQELWDCVLSVNPFDIQEQADAIYRALTMDPEQKAEWRGLRKSSSPATPATGSTTSSPTSKKPAPRTSPRPGESLAPALGRDGGRADQVARGRAGGGDRPRRLLALRCCRLLRAPEPPPLGRRRAAEAKPGGWPKAGVATLPEPRVDRDDRDSTTATVPDPAPSPKPGTPEPVAPLPAPNTSLRRSGTLPAPPHRRPRLATVAEFAPH